MPKVFLTGSNVTRGYVTGSGFITLPPRVMIRQKDARTGSYPTIKRIGDVSRQGNYTVNFDDSNTINFNTPYATAEIAFLGRRTDSLNQIRPAPNSLITLRGTNGQVKTFEFVLSGSSTSNASYQAVEMPFIAITSTDPLPQGAVLEIENRKIAKSFVEAVNNSNLRIRAKLKAFTGPTRLDKSKNYIRSLIPKHTVDYVDNLALSGIAHSSNYYVILEQELPGSGGNLLITTSSVLTSDARVIGLSTPATFTGGKSNQVYPSLGLTSNYQKFLSQSHASPNFLDTNLVGTGRTLPGVSDAHIEFTPGEDLLPFDESRINITDDIFFNQGVSPDVIPGFAYKLGDKTQITYDLSPSTPTEFGYKRNLGRAGAPEGDISGKGQILMVYWNNVNKKWEEIGHEFSPNLVPDPSPTSMKEIITGSCIGFAAASPIGTASSNSSEVRFFDSSYLKSIGKPTDAFSFPFGAQYHATSSQWIRASDLGINTPFVLEKLSLNFTMKMGISNIDSWYPTPSDELWNSTLFYPNYSHPGAGGPSTLDIKEGLKMFMPTFFMLRQKKGKFEKVIDFHNARETFYGVDKAIQYTSTIPSRQILASGSNEYIDVNETRELITFGEICILATGSADGATNAHFTKSSSGDIYTPDEILDAGLSRDLNIVIENLNMLERNSLTGSFDLNFECKTVPKRNRLPNIQFYESSISTRSEGDTGQKNRIHLGNDSGGRSKGDLEDGNRALVNGIGALKPTGQILLPGPIPAKSPQTSSLPEGNSSLVSPFLINPEDKLIFGWQYPYESNLSYNLPSGVQPFYTMTLYDKSQLTLFGSQLRNNEEFHDTLNQPLNSDAIHEAIHYDNPVVDQFDIETAYEYSGSYITRARGGDDVTTFTGDEVSGRKTYLGHNISTVTEPHLSSSFNRFVKMENFKEKFYDSFVPDPEQGMKDLESSGVGFTQVGDVSFYAVTYSRKNTSAYSDEWSRMFPFSGKLSQTRRLSDVKNKSTSLVFFGVNALNGSDPDNDGSIYYPTQIQKNLAYSGSFLNTLKSLYGVSTKTPRRTVKVLSDRGDGVFDNGLFAGAVYVFQEQQFEMSGFKYGLLNAVPQSTTSVFRRDRYGQFRDMLEQRLDSKFLNVRRVYQNNPNPDFSLSNTFEHSVQNDSSLIYEKSPNPSPIKVLFASGTNTGGSLGTIYNVIPDIQLEIDSNPFFQSSNINTECTSSLPFFDDNTPRNRNYPTEFI